MTTVSKEATTCNYSDDELTFQQLIMRCQTLETQITNLLKIKKDLTNLNEKNETTSKSLLELKSDYELYKSHLNKVLYNLNTSADKDAILSKKNLNEYLEKRKTYEENFKNLPINSELENLIQRNKALEVELKRRSDLLDITKNQYKELLNTVTESFKDKVCDFCDEVLRLKNSEKVI